MNYLCPTLSTIRTIIFNESWVDGLKNHDKYSLKTFLIDTYVYIYICCWRGNVPLLLLFFVCSLTFDMCHIFTIRWLCDIIPRQWSQCLMLLWHRNDRSHISVHYFYINKARLSLTPYCKTIYCETNYENKHITQSILEASKNVWFLRWFFWPEYFQKN